MFTVFATSLKSAGSNPMGVQVPLSEPHNKGVISYNASLFREAFLVWWLFLWLLAFAVMPQLWTAAEWRFRRSARRRTACGRATELANLLSRKPREAVLTCRASPTASTITPPLCERNTRLRARRPIPQWALRPWIPERLPARSPAAWPRESPSWEGLRCSS